jgi:CRP-like cAMP-binding protein
MAVSKGEIRISCHSSDGKEAVLAIFRSGDVFGEIALLDGKERTTDATAITACELVVLERRDIMPVLEQQPKICLKLMDALCQRLRRTNDQVLDVLFFQLPIRLAKALLRTAGRRISATKRETLHVRVSQRELGAMIGATRESVNKCLSEWQRQGIIEVKAGVIIILEVAELTRISEVQ